MRPTLEAMAVLVVLLSCLTRPGRLALCRLAIATVAGAAPLLTMVYLVTRATVERCRYGCNLDAHNTPILNIVPIAFFLSSGIVTGVLGRHQEDWAQLAQDRAP
jgi:hypothetical protein